MSPTARTAPVAPPVMTEAEPFVPVVLTEIRTTNDIAAVLVEIRDAAVGIRAQMVTDVERYELAENPGTEIAVETHANLAAAIVTLANAVEALAKVNA